MCCILIHNKMEWDDSLLSKLTETCMRHGDFESAKTFSVQTTLPLFVRCRFCLNPLSAEHNARLRVRKPRTLTLSCPACASSRGAKLKLNKRKKRRLESTQKPRPEPPIAQVAPEKQAPVVKATEPTLSLIEMAERKAKEERRAKRQKEKTSLTKLAHLLDS